MKKSGNISLLLCACLCIYLINERVNRSNAGKIGVVEMDKLVYDYRGMKEATDTYTKKLRQWELHSDSLEAGLSELYKQIRLDSLNRDVSKLNKDIKVFTVLQRSYLDFVEDVKQKAEKEDKQMTLGVINQVKECIQNYARENGYSAILCNSQSQQQSVGYVERNIDLTQEVLEYANNKYEGM